MKTRIISRLYHGKSGILNLWLFYDLRFNCRGKLVVLRLTITFANILPWQMFIITLCGKRNVADMFTVRS